MRSSGFAVGQGGYGGPKGPKDAAPVPKIPKRTPDWISKEQTFPGSALLYRLNGDYNPLHASPENGYNASIDVANLKERKWDFQVRSCMASSPGMLPLNTLFRNGRMPTRLVS